MLICRSVVALMQLHSVRLERDEIYDRLEGASSKSVDRSIRSVGDEALVVGLCADRIAV